MATNTGLYREIVQKALRISWEHKHLWIFGFFAGLIGFGGIADVVMNVYDTDLSLSPFIIGSARLSTVIPGGSLVSALVHGSPDPALAAVALALLGMAFLGAFVWTAVVSIGALISGIRKTMKGGDLHFSQSIAAGSPLFPKLLGVQLVTKIMAAIIHITIGLALLYLVRERTPIGAIVYIGSFFVFTAAAIVASLLTVYASNDIVADGRLGAREALERAWNLLGKTWLTGIEASIILAFCTALIGIAAAAATAVFLVPMLFFLTIAGLLKATAAVTAILALSTVFLIAAAIVAGSFSSVFQTAAWTLLWTELGDDGHVPLLARAMRSMRRAFKK